VIANRARELTGADCAAVGFRRDPTDRFDPFAFSGDPDVLSPELLSLPTHPPHAGPFLAVPLMNETPVGQLFLLRRPGREPFDDQDERIARLLATHSVVAANNQRLYRNVCRAVRTRDEVLAIVSHDLRNPLSIIRATADQLTQLAPAEEAIGLVRREGERVGRAAER